MCSCAFLYFYMIYFCEETASKSSVINHWPRKLEQLSFSFTKKHAFGGGKEKKPKPKEFKIKYSSLQTYNQAETLFTPANLHSQEEKCLRVQISPVLFCPSAKTDSFLLPASGPVRFARYHLSPEVCTSCQP